MEAASLETMRNSMLLSSRKQYGRDLLYRSGDSHYVLLRYLSSDQARSTAQEIPRCCAAGLAWETKLNPESLRKLEEVGYKIVWR